MVVEKQRFLYGSDVAAPTIRIPIKTHYCVTVAIMVR